MGPFAALWWLIRFVFWGGVLLGWLAWIFLLFVAGPYIYEHLRAHPNLNVTYSTRPTSYIVLVTNTGADPITVQAVYINYNHASNCPANGGPWHLQVGEKLTLPQALVIPPGGYCGGKPTLVQVETDHGIGYYHLN
jgi:hypothetical protein